MPDKNKILAICGSTRASSTNLNLIKAIQDIANEVFTIEIFEGLSQIPHFNPDLDNGNAPAPVTSFREKLKQADGILICTPEYAMGVPGSLKNAIDWTVSSCEFSHKPTALITASSSGVKGHASLLDTLKIIEASITDETQLLISYCKTKISNDCKITDEKTLLEVKALINALAKTIASK
jgi:chromate reductase